MSSALPNYVLFDLFILNKKGEWLKKNTRPGCAGLDVRAWLPGLKA
jgi:hypothetical protein